MTCTMDVPNGSGHLTLTWDPDDPPSVERARATFDELKAKGYAFFVSPEPTAARIKNLKAPALTVRGELDVRPEIVKEFRPRARRTVAMRPMRGG